MLLYIACILTIVFIFGLLMTSSDKKVAGVYSQPNHFFTLKFWVFMIMYNLRQRQNKASRSMSNQDAGLGKKSRSSVEEMEIAQVLPLEYPKAVDAVYFNGGNKDGCFLSVGTARRHDLLTETLCFVRIPGVGMLQMLNLPDTSVRRSEDLAFAAGGLRLEPDQPMRTWTLTFSGQMKLTKEDGSCEEVNVDFDLGWLALTKPFDFDTDLNPEALSTAIATESWSKQFFDTLNKAHQTHYEQFGEITGTVKVSDHGDHEIHIQGLRDHSYGNVRDWSYFHRYALQYIYLEDNTAICVGNICMPITTSRLIVGYVMHRDGRVDTVSSTDLQLYRMGEDGADPNNFAFNFVAEGKKYSVEGHVLARGAFYMGPDWESRLVERMCNFTVNEVAGWGFSQFAYRNTSGKPASHTDTEREQ